MCRDIKANARESVLTNQLLRSGTSIGANIREGVNGVSKADFKYKLGIALKEAKETDRLWWKTPRLFMGSESGIAVRTQWQSGSAIGDGAPRN